MNVNNEYEDDYYETSDFETAHFDEEFDEGSPAKSPRAAHHSTSKKKSLKKKRRLEDWLEEKRLRDELQDEQ